ncbi:MAG: divalent-cation tolerance protein CutA [Steroidobacteraceae bacterium]
MTVEPQAKLGSEALVVLCTCPDEAVADRIARELVTARLAACVNRLPGVRSVFRWQGALQDEREVLLAIKTSRSRYEELEMRLKALHPYEVPEIIALPVLAGAAPYLAWLAEETRPSADMRNSP